MYTQRPYQQVPSYQPAPSRVGAGPTDAVHWLLPTGRSWQSIAAGYVALFAMIIWPLGPVALALGVTALRRARVGGHGRGRAVFAVTVGGLTTAALLLVVLAVIRDGAPG
jgi:hypothetical protein